MTVRLSWQLDGQCQDADPALFFPEAHTGKHLRNAQDTIYEFCVPCPVRTKCLRHALDQREIYGIWGGMTEPERAAFRRRLGRGRLRPEDVDTLSEAI